MDSLEKSSNQKKLFIFLSDQILEAVCFNSRFYWSTKFVAVINCCFAFVANMQPVLKNDENMHAAIC